MRGRRFSRDPDGCYHQRKQYDKPAKQYIKSERLRKIEEENRDLCLNCTQKECRSGNCAYYRKNHKS